jgi:NhaP-type Na+/H+ or K+/H+ antiporter
MPLHCCVGMSWGVVLFTTFGGLRGAVSLILAQILVLDQEKKVLSSRHITAEARCA